MCYRHLCRYHTYSLPGECVLCSLIRKPPKNALNVQTNVQGRFSPPRGWSAYAWGKSLVHSSFSHVPKHAPSQRSRKLIRYSSRTLRPTTRFALAWLRVHSYTYKLLFHLINNAATLSVTYPRPPPLRSRYTTQSVATHRRYETRVKTRFLIVPS